MPAMLVALLLLLHTSQVKTALGHRASSKRVATVSRLIVKHANDLRVDPVLVAAIVSIENPRLESAARGGKNVGIMQVDSRWLRRNDWKRECGEKLTDADTNICFGVRVLQVHLEEYESVTDGLLAYNGCKSAKCRGYAERVIARRDAAVARTSQAHRRAN